MGTQKQQQGSGKRSKRHDAAFIRKQSRYNDHSGPLPGKIRRYAKSCGRSYLKDHPTCRAVKATSMRPFLFELQMKVMEGK